MPASAKQLKALGAATPPEEIGTLKGRKNNKSGTTSPDMSYITARFAAERLDGGVGPENWAMDFRRDGTNRLYVGVGVFCEGGEFGQWVWKWDTGEESNIEAGKGEFSDSFKRACVHWGIARDLYPSPNKATARKKPAQTAKSKPAPKAKPQRDPGEDEVVDAEKDVVGQTGLTKKQKAKLFATLRDAGVPDDKRKELVHTICGKWSTTEMTNDDLDLVLTFAEDGEWNPDGNNE